LWTCITTNEDLADSLLEGTDISGKISTEALLELINKIISLEFSSWVIQDYKGLMFENFLRILEVLMVLLQKTL